jgi:hypothetical protein
MSALPRTALKNSKIAGLRGATSITEGDAAAAESHTNLQANARLYVDIAEVEEPARHRLEFRIDRFTHLLRGCM